MQHLNSGRPRAAGLLLGVLLAAVMPLATDGAVSAPAVAMGSTPAGADYLYLQPAAGLDADALAAAVRALGFDAVLAHEDGARLTLPEGADPSSVAARLARSGLVRSVEADALVVATEERREPNDPLFARYQQAYLDVIRAPEAWALETGSRDVVIAVVDTGIDYDHPDLTDRLFVNEREQFLNRRDDDRNGCVDDIVGCNFVSLDIADPSCRYTEEPPNWRSMDDEGHGTFVAALAVGTGDNEVGMAGLAWGVRILPVKVLDCTATGRISDAAAGIRYAARMGADIINISFGTLNESPALADAVRFARALGALVVASAGNDGRRGVTYPARYPEVLSVAASGLLGADGIDYRATATFANFGGDIDFLAPGVDLLSAVPRHLCGRKGWSCVEGGPYAVASGSSFATPLVSGALALMLSQHPDLSPDFATALLLASRQRGATVGDAPLLDIAAALQRTLFLAGAAGTAREGGGTPPGPAAPD